MTGTAYVHAADIRTQSPKARAEQEARRAVAEAALRHEGAQEERRRIWAIISAPEALYRHRTALAIALKSDLTVEVARDLLSKIGEGTA